MSLTVAQSDLGISDALQIIGERRDTLVARAVSVPKLAADRITRPTICGSWWQGCC